MLCRDLQSFLPGVDLRIAPDSDWLQQVRGRMTPGVFMSQPTCGPTHISQETEIRWHLTYFTPVVFIYVPPPGLFQLFNFYTMIPFLLNKLYTCCWHSMGFCLLEYRVQDQALRADCAQNVLVDLCSLLSRQREHCMGAQVTAGPRQIMSPFHTPTAFLQNDIV